MDEVLRAVQEFTDLSWGPGVHQEDFMTSLSGLLERAQEHHEMDKKLWEEKNMTDRILNCARSIIAMSGSKADARTNKTKKAGTVQAEAAAAATGGDGAAGFTSAGMSDLGRACLRTYDALRGLLFPFIQHPPKGSTVQQQRDMIANHKQHIEDFKDSLGVLQDVHGQPISFGEGSDYMFWLVHRAEEDYLFTLDTFGLHLSYFSCQMSEHLNKVVKAALKYLHGFTTRAVGSRPKKKEEDVNNNGSRSAPSPPSNLFNKVGHVMRDQMINKRVLSGAYQVGKKI